MRTDVQPAIATSAPPTQGRSSRPWFWLGIGVAAVGLVSGTAFGITSYQDSQQQIDTFARMPVPGTMTVQVGEPGRQVVYFEGAETVVIDDLLIGIVDPAGATLTVAPFEGELIYETTNLTPGRAIASFEADGIGAYQVEVSGVDTGQITIGESFSRIALPGVLAGLAIAGLSLIAGFVLWLFAIVRR
ncbi:MAG TPA: hypothetical protein VLA91_05140 [Acidimicrobiia bacterium]|nr:hypothetical protein [Acidimicrobiia bacterium]